jgi:hypothetical protein
VSYPAEARSHPTMGFMSTIAPSVLARGPLANRIDEVDRWMTRDELSATHLVMLKLVELLF